MRSRWVPVLAVSAGVAFGGASSGVVAPAAGLAVDRPVITDVMVFSAPAGEKGGIYGSVVTCSNSDVAPKVRWILTDTASGESRHFSWTEMDIAWPRVPAGHYRSATTAWCGKDKATAIEQVTVRRQTPATTISRAEFNRISEGMSPQQVARIVGYDGDLALRDGSEMLRTYDRTEYAVAASVVFRHDQVVDAWWEPQVGG